jgi:hypothetical protein
MATGTGAGTGAQTLGALSGEVVAQVRNLVRDELELGRINTRQRLAAARRGAALLGAAAFLAAVGVGCLAAAALIGLSTVLDRPWFAGVIVAVALLFLALFVVLPGWRGVVVERARAVGIDTRASVEHDIAAVRDAARQDGRRP